jgi:PTS system nitrogen regulatory IIA component
VDLIFALIVPEEQNDEHLATLARIASMMQNDQSRQSLRQCNNNEELFNTALQLERLN